MMFCAARPLSSYCRRVRLRGGAAEGLVDSPFLGWGDGEERGLDDEPVNHRRRTGPADKYQSQEGTVHVDDIEMSPVKDDEVLVRARAARAKPWSWVTPAS